MIEMSEEDRKRVATILKMWDYFGPTAQNMGASDNSTASYLNTGTIVNVGTEVGPYVPVIYPQMMDYFAKILNKLYSRGR